ncbi:hypothetical protein [Thermaurantiacus sp.]
MSTEIKEIATALAARLYAAEEAIDSAVQAASDLASFLPLAGRSVRASAFLGQDAMEHTSASLATLCQARRHLLATHSALTKAQTRLGLQEQSFGGFIDKPRHRASAKADVKAKLPASAENEAR